MEKKRCAWCCDGGLNQIYHDNEWSKLFLSPDCGSPEEMKQRILAHKHTLVLQTIWEVSDYSDMGVIKSAKSAHNQAEIRLVTRLRAEGCNGFIVGASGCALWFPCAQTHGEPCRFPEYKYSCTSKVIFQIEGGSPVTIECNAGDNLLEAARRANVAIDAPCSGIDTLLQSVDMTPGGIDKVYVADGIGFCINMKNAVHIGMLPDVELERFRYIGNSSLTGAYAMVMSDEVTAKTAEVAANMTYLELSTYSGYMDSFVAACFIPHTDSSLFPHSI